MPTILSPDFGPQYPKDPPFTARMRLHQSWYRARVSERPRGVGPRPTNKTFYGNMLTQADGEERGLNFLTPHIFTIARRRLAEKRGTIDRYRVLCNMLSSQPMCFNLFGPLVDDRELATALVQALLPGEVEAVTRVLIEYAPEPPAGYLNDRTAFDAFIEYTRPDRSQGFLASRDEVHRAALAKALYQPGLPPAGGAARFSLAARDLEPAGKPAGQTSSGAITCWPKRCSATPSPSTPGARSCSSTTPGTRRSPSPLLRTAACSNRRRAGPLSGKRRWTWWFAPGRGNWRTNPSAAGWRILPGAISTSPSAKRRLEAGRMDDRPNQGKEAFRTRLLRGDLLTGTLVTLPSTEIAEILAEAGFDWLFVDLEHSTLDVRAAQSILQAVGGRVDCLLRVPLNDEIWIKKALDTGASGIIVPQVNSAADARRAVRCSKYPPQGGRSAGMARAHGYGARAREYFERANAGIALIVQAEHVEAVRNIEAILEVEGVDAVFIGPYDLSASLGKMGQVEDPDVQAAIERVRRACRERGTPLGIFAASGERARDYVADGYRLVAAGGDALLLAQSARQLARSLRGQD